MHSAKLLKLLLKNKFFDLLSSQDEIKRMKKLILSSILSTDMSKHQDFVDTLKSRIESTQIVMFEQKHGNQGEVRWLKI